MHIAIYGAALSTLIVLVGGGRWLYVHATKRSERKKFRTDLYLLRKIDRTTKETHPIVVALLANLGKERIALKGLYYSGVAENGCETSGCMGWYEQPDEAYGIRNRLLPLILESGQTADLPMINIGVITETNNLKIWFTDFDDNNIFLEEKDILSVKRHIEKYLNEQKNS